MILFLLKILILLFSGISIWYGITSILKVYYNDTKQIPSPEVTDLQVEEVDGKYIITSQIVGCTYYYRLDNIRPRDVTKFMLTNVSCWSRYKERASIYSEENLIKINNLLQELKINTMYETPLDEYLKLSHLNYTEHEKEIYFDILAQKLNADGN